MKKTIFIITLILTSMIFVSSCSKEQVSPTNENSKVKHQNLRLEGDSTIELITEFIYKLDNPSIGTPMNIEDVIWNIEAALNYKYGNIEKVNYLKYLSGDKNQEYSLEGGEMEFSQVKALYDGFKEHLSIIYNGINSDNKWLLLVDIDIKEDNTITMFYAFGEDQITIVKQASQWNSWYYGEDKGMCSGGGIPSDAANEIDKELRADFIANNNQYFTPLYHWVATSITYPGPSIPGGFPGPVSLINNADVTPQDNQYDYILFHSYNGWPNYHICLNPTEMNFYYDGSVHIITTLEGSYPTKEVVWSKLSDFSQTVGGPNGIVKGHGLDVRFGNWIKIPDINSSTL